MPLGAGHSWFVLVRRRTASFRAGTGPTYRARVMMTVRLHKANSLKSYILYIIYYILYIIFYILYFIFHFIFYILYLIYYILDIRHYILILDIIDYMLLL